jgi:hypothetical protein
MGKTFNHAPAPPQPPIPDLSTTYKQPDLPFFSKYFVPKFESGLVLTAAPAVVQRNKRGSTEPTYPADSQYHAADASIDPAGEIVLSAHLEDGLVPLKSIAWELLPLSKLVTPTSGFPYGDYVDSSIFVGGLISLPQLSTDAAITVRAEVEALGAWTQFYSNAEAVHASVTLELRVHEGGPGSDLRVSELLYSAEHVGPTNGIQEDVNVNYGMPIKTLVVNRTATPGTEKLIVEVVARLHVERLYYPSMAGTLFSDFRFGGRRDLSAPLAKLLSISVEAR